MIYQNVIKSNEQNDKVILDKNKIYEYQQNREPYLMIDFAKVIPGKSSKGYKD